MRDCEAQPTGWPEAWAGIECTVNRVGDRYFDQSSRTGHDQRPADIERLAELGITAVRYPIVWERTEPDDNDTRAHWAWATERLALLRRFHLRPIAGLVHHGSGPPNTSLLDPGFAPALAEYAGRVAERFPWLDAYTPVNEPLTTARFSALYGCWYPHATDDSSFAKALLNQCKAVALSMAAIRRVNSDAQLIQTEDLGQTHAPPALIYQAEFENHRRWLTWDLLSGRVDRRHALWQYLNDYLALPEAELMWFADNPCLPDVIGVNHYVTSERYLDDRLDRYRADLHGGNGRHSYADVEAVRILPQGCLGPQSLLEQAWDRYGIPVAVTEAHLGCSREEQLRWLRDVWEGACAAKRNGADVRAVTAWSAFGAFDWDSLVTRDEGHYETGLFDVRCDPPRPTALARAVSEMATEGIPTHPVLADDGWWKRPCRLYDAGSLVCTPPRGAPILITDGDCRFGKAFAAACNRRGLAFVTGRFDRRDSIAVRNALANLRPWAVIDTGVCPRLRAAASDPEGCRMATAAHAALWAEACDRVGCKLVMISSDFVFNGRLGRAYREGDEVAPLNGYGAAKAEAEKTVLAASPAALVVRSGLVFGKCGVRDFLSAALRTVHDGGLFPAADDFTTSAAYLPDLVHAVLDLLIDDEHGIVHLAGPEAMTWADLAREAVRGAGLDTGRIEARNTESFGSHASRHVYTPLASERGIVLPSFESSLIRFLREVDWRAAA